MKGRSEGGGYIVNWKKWEAKGKKAKGGKGFGKGWASFISSSSAERRQYRSRQPPMAIKAVDFSLENAHQQPFG